MSTKNLEIRQYLLTLYFELRLVQSREGAKHSPNSKEQRDLENRITTLYEVWGDIQTISDNSKVFQKF